MKAFVFDQSLHFTDVPVPLPLPGEALIRVLYSSICNTDLEITRGYMGFRGIPGHEFVGVVATEGSPLYGRRVVGEINCSCGKCYMCRTGRKTHCPHRTVLGIYNRPGVFAEYTSLPEKNLHIVPDAIRDEEAVFTEPLAAALEILEQCDIGSSRSVFIFGAGKLGLLVAQAFQAREMTYVLFDRNPFKIEKARQIGLLCQPFSSLKTGAKAEICIDCTGHRQGIMIALDHLYPRGKLILKTTVAKTARIDLNQLVINETQIHGSRCGPFAPALEMLEKKLIKTESMVSGVFGFDDIPGAFDRARSKKIIKILIRH